MDNRERKLTASIQLGNGVFLILDHNLFQNDHQPLPAFTQALKLLSLVRYVLLLWFCLCLLMFFISLFKRFFNRPFRLFSNGPANTNPP